ncbi:MAG: hypothetical protein IT487_12260 [Chromatiaceae bacterium]|nr:hypothetical protein [Chromatiaceae bacterium]
MLTLWWRLPWLILALGSLALYLVPPGGVEWFPLTAQAPRVVRDLMTEGRFAEAQETATFALAQADETQQAALEPLVAELQTLRADPAYRWDQVLEGIGTGTAAEVEGQVAGALTDLIPLVGDLRDVLREGWRWAVVDDQEPDAVILTLSFLGLVTTGAPPLKGGLGLVKRAQRLKLLPPWLTRELVSLGGEIRTSLSLAPAKSLLGPLTTLTEQVGVRDALRLLPRTTSRESLAAWVSLVRIFGRDTGSLVRLGGEAVVKARAQAPRLNPDLLKRASIYGPAGVNALVRWGPTRFGHLVHLTKVVYRQPWLGALGHGWLRMPRWLWLLTAGLGLLGMRPWRGHHWPLPAREAHPG